MKNFALLVFLFLVTFAKAQQKSERLVIDGITRSFISYVPSPAQSTGKMPVIISLHGRLGTGRNMLGFADFRPLADKDRFIIVCPDGISKSWNVGRATPAFKKGINDVKFIGQLITYVINTYNGDADRVYVTGMSNGGFMASRLACELSDRIAAIAVVGASMDKGMDYRPNKSIPVMYIQGTLDPLVPYAGGFMKGAGGEIYSHIEILKLWADNARCNPQPVNSNLPVISDDGTSVIKEEYINNETGIKVIGYTITKGGHTWPDGTQYLPRFVIGSVSHNLDACRVIWEFFKDY